MNDGWQHETADAVDLRLADLLAEGGKSGSATSTPKPVPQCPLSPPERNRLERARSCLQLLQQARPGAGSTWVTAKGASAGVDDKPDELSAALKLVAAEIRMRQELGQPPELEEYLGRYPELAAHLQAWFSTVSAPNDQLQPNVASRSDNSSSSPPIPGYVIERELGRGGMGVVYQALHLRLKRIVALKTLRDGAADAEYRQRFLREAEAVARLQHPNIVQIYEFGEHEGRPFLALELVEGGSLANRLNGTPQPGRLAAELVQALARAMHYAHQQGIVHRDLKPANVLLQSPPSQDAGFGTPKISDFGLAKRLNDDSAQTHSGTVVGTPSYMSPEQANGQIKQIGPLSDVYALGAILYELLTGRPPFKGATPTDTLLQVLAEEPVPPRGLQPQVPRDLEIICLKCLDKQPHKRYASALELAEDLRRALAGEPIAARPASVWERACKWVRRRPALAALTVVSAVAVLASAGVVTASFYTAQLREAKERAERFQYFYHIALAHGGWQNGNLGPFEPLLDDCPADQRNWEWHYLKRLCHGDLLTLRGHAHWIWTVVFSPDGTRLASASRDGTVKLWDAMTGRQVLTFPTEASEVGTVTFSPDGRRLASPSANHTVTVWDAVSGREIASFAVRAGGFRQLVFSPDGTRLASAHNDRTVRVWDVASGREIWCLRGHAGMDVVFGVAFSPDGKRLASAGQDETVRVWDAARGREIAALRSHTSWVTGVTFSPDGTRLASASSDGTLKVWDATAYRELCTLSGHASEIAGVAFSPDGTRLASGSTDQSVKVWDAVSGKLVLTHKGHTNAVTSVAFSPDGARLASASKDRTVRVWNVTSGQEAVTLKGHSGKVWNVALSADGRRLASAGDERTVKLWDTTTGAVIQNLHGHTRGVYGVAINPEGTRIASADGDGTVKVWDVRTGQIVLDFKAHADVVWSVAFSPDGARLASASHDGTAKVWDALSGQELLTYRGHDRRVLSVTFSPDGRRLASAGDDTTVQVWDAATGQMILTLRGHAECVEGIAFSHDGKRLASAGYDQSLKVWDVATGALVVTLIGHSWPVTGVTFSPDGTRLASASGDGTVKVWDVNLGRETLTLHGHTQRVQCVVFNAEGTCLYSGSHDGTIKIWDARPLTPEIASEYAANSLIEYLLARPLCRDDVRAYLRRSVNVSTDVCRKALELIDIYDEERKPGRFAEASWAVARQPYLNEVQYGFALRQAETACRLAPSERGYRTALGVAQYRVGSFAEAAATLTESPCQQPDAPGILAFLAMAQHQQGKKEHARATLERLRKQVDGCPAGERQRAQVFLHEAETLLQTTPKVLPAQ